jgi:GT2 family glycosyltransferase
MIEIVSATQLSETDFWNQAALGISLRRVQYDRRLAANITFANGHSLAEIYNSRIAAAHGAEILVFIHDDVWIDDYFLADRVIDGLKAFHLLGVAGNRRRVPQQPAWAFVDAAFTWDEKANLSGWVAHGKSAFGDIVWFGEVPAACELLDGLFLAARRDVLLAHGVQFDPRFLFHFYDLDFCRTARQRGLRLGTWPIALTHQSAGAFDTPPWHAAYRAYLEKWGD